MNREILKLYAVTDKSCLHGKTLAGIVEQVLQNGVSILQLREKYLTGSELLAEALQIKDICRKYNVPLIINDDVELAAAIKADGVHLGQDDGDIRSARKILGPKAYIGVSAHNVAEAVAAESAGADYLGCGAVFTTSTKSGTTHLAVESLREICSTVSIPAVAIGGICTDNISLLRGSGIAGVAVASALFGAADPVACAQRLLCEVENL